MGRCQLNSVSFVKPIAPENEHPGYTSESRGSEHLVGLLRAIERSRCAKDTMVVVTYDEFGGQWDHVSPPGQGSATGVHDQWGPGTRIPALIVSPFLRGDFVIDHTQYDTTSILATIEKRFGLASLNSRDAAVHDLSNVYNAMPFSEDEDDEPVALGDSPRVRISQASPSGKLRCLSSVSQNQGRKEQGRLADSIRRRPFQCPARIEITSAAAAHSGRLNMKWAMSCANREAANWTRC
jgi:phospholipase C